MTEEAYHLVRNYFGHELPPLEAVEVATAAMDNFQGQEGRPDAGGDPTGAPSLVGKWSATFQLNGNRFTTLSVLKLDGTATFVVLNEARQAVNKGTGRYTYANGVLSAQYDSGVWEKATITWVNPNQVLYKVIGSSNPAAIGLQMTVRRLG